MKDLFKIFKLREIGSTFTGEINPKREWFFAIMIFIIGAVVLGFLSFRSYQNMQPEKITASVISKIPISEKINITNLDKAVLNFEKITEKFNTLKKVNLVDPSL